jgi:hypothetical protein
MNVEKLKLKLKELFGEQIVFNKDFDSYAASIKNLNENFLPWCESVKKGGISIIPTSRKLNSVVFIKKIGSSNRCIIIKVINGEFKEIHLGNHAYYDKLRTILGIKRGSKSY